MWWNYYNLSSEPYLSQESLKTKKDLTLFYGREKEIERLNIILEDSSYKKTLLLIGNPGVGKTSLVYKLYFGKEGFIYVDLSRKQFSDAEVGIAESCIITLSKINRKKANEYRQRLISNITNTVGNSLTGKVAPGGIGFQYNDIILEAINPVRNIEVIEIIKDVLKEINKKGRIIMILDESDFFDNIHFHDLIHLSKRVKDMLPASSILIFINRDITAVLEKAYKDTMSLTRSTFNDYFKVESAWKYGETNIQEVLKERFRDALTKPEAPFPLSVEACDFVDVLSSGNFRLLIQYLENALKFGAVYKKPVPLEINFVQEQIFRDFNEIITLTQQEEKVLTFLKSKPTHVNDPAIRKLYKRTTLQNIVKELEQRLLVSRNTKKPGIPQIYSVSHLGKIVLEKAIIESSPTNNTLEH